MLDTELTSQESADALTRWLDERKRLQKPVKGEAFLESKDRRADRRDAEQDVMQAALKRDDRRCRWPGCTGKHRGLLDRGDLQMARDFVRLALYDIDLAIFRGKGRRPS